MGMKWSCSGSRFLETKVSYAEPGMADVHQFVQESSLALEEDAEMKAVADTFPGVQNLNGVFRWGRYSGNRQNEQMLPKHVENDRNDHSCRAQLVVKDVEPEWINNRSAENWARLGESRLLSSLWKILTHRTSTRHSVELIEFAKDLSNDKLTTTAPSLQAH